MVRWSSFLSTTLIVAAVSAHTPAHGFGKKRLPPPVSQEPIAWDPAAGAHGRFTLRMMTYNVQVRPIFDKSTKCSLIAASLKERKLAGHAPHIVAIQEAFEGECVDRLKRAGYPTLVRGPSAEFPALTNSGLTILADFQLLKKTKMSYSSCAGPDCLSTKGVIHVQFKIPGLPIPIDVYNTHANAHYDEYPPHRMEGERMRKKQFKQVGQMLLNTHNHSLPAFFMGDINTTPGRSDYNFLQLALNMNAAIEDCSDTASCDGSTQARRYWPGTLDHQFYRSIITGPHDQKIQVQITRFDETFDHKKGGGFDHFSDHTANEIDYEFRW